MKSLLDAKARAAKTRCITEITNENLSYCKELINLTDELRHLEGVRPNFMISEKEILLAPLSLRKEKMRHRESQTRHIVYSNLKEIVQQQQYLFDSLWDKGVSAEERIKKIEEGRDSHHYEITIIRNPQEIIKDISRQIEDSNELLICTTAGGLQWTPYSEKLPWIFLVNLE
jgi:two-component system sensor histidine kinase VicK